jgi:hypothetical protein
VPIAALLVAFLSAPVQAGSITYVTPSGSSTNEGPVNDEAVFTTTAGKLTIAHTDLRANPKDAAQLLGDLSFTLGGGNLTGATPHNPFLNESATFTVTGAGITDATTVTSATFSFGTTPGIAVGGVVSEPRSPVLGLAGIGVVACARLYRSRHKA